MPKKGETRKPPKMPQDLDEGEFQTLILSVAELLRSAKSIDDRRNLVMILDGRGLRRSEIAKIVCKSFGISIKTLDDDLEWVRDQWNDYATKMNKDKAMAEVLKTNKEIKRRAMAQGDLANANRANEHFAALTRVTDPLNHPDPNVSSSDPEQQRARLLALLLPDGAKGGKVKP